MPEAPLQPEIFNMLAKLPRTTMLGHALHPGEGFNAVS